MAFLAHGEKFIVKLALFLEQHVPLLFVLLAGRRIDVATVVVPSASSRPSHVRWFLSRFTSAVIGGSI